MSNIKLNNETLGIISFFTKITDVSVKDCISSDDKIIFVIEKDLSKAIGRNGVTVKKLVKKFNKKIEIIMYNNDLLTFFKNLVYPTSVGSSFVTEKSDGSKIINVGTGVDKTKIKQKMSRTINLLNKYHDDVQIKL